MPDPWPFADPKDLAVYTLRRIIRDGSPVLFVSHDEDDGAWQFLDGAEADAPEAAIVSLFNIVKLDPSLLALADLPLGWSAQRSGPGEPWERIDPEQARDRQVVSDVEQFGWHVVLIPADDEGPGFAFSVGLFKSFGHPEVVLFGLGVEAMHGIINGIGEEVRRGRKFTGGEAASGVIEGFDVQFCVVHHDHYREYLGTASWFYKQADYPALQCVWPDRRGRFPWDNDFPSALRSIQPVLDRPLGDADEP